MMLHRRSFMQAACMAAFVLSAFSCSQEEFETNARRGNITVTASFEGAGGADTRTTVNDLYQVVWQETDALALFDTEGTKIKLDYVSGAGGTTATFSNAGESDKTQSFSIYPYQEGMSAGSNTLSMTLPAALTDYAGSSNGPMYAKVTDPNNVNALSFKHMAALIKLTVNKIPADATTFKITASNNIAGPCTADLTVAEPVLKVTDGQQAVKEVTATFAASSTTTSRSFYIPLPVGRYQFIIAQLTNGSDKVYFTKTLNDKTLNRRDLLEVPALDCITVEAATPDALTQALASADNLPQSAPEKQTVTDIAIIGNFSNADNSNAIQIPVVEKSDINLAFNTVPATTSGALQLTDKFKESQTTPAATSTNKVSIAIPEVTQSDNAPSLSIDMPRTTVTLAAVGEKTTYNEVTATTALKTLVINAGVTVKKLTIKGGNVVIYGTVEELVREGETTVEVTSLGAADIKNVSTPGNFTFKSTWDGISKVEPTNGNIFTAAQLAYYQSKTAPNDKNAKSLPATMTIETTTLYADIDLAKKPWLGMVINGKTFDGQNHTVSNLEMSQYILNQQETKYTPQACIGFFAAVYGAATIKNIVLENVTIRPDASVSPKWVGALVGYSMGIGTNYENCIAKAVDIFTHGRASYRVGGLIGYIEKDGNGTADDVATAVLKGCKVEGATIAASFSYGGLVGSIYDSATFEDCSTSNITLQLNGECDTYGYVSNFIGDIANEGTKKRMITIKNCTTDAIVNESALNISMGGCKWCGIVEPESVPNFTIKVTENNGTEKTLVAGTDFNVIRNIPWDGKSAFEPKCVDNTYNITAPTELAWVARQVEAKNTFEGKTIKLCADLDLNNKTWKPIGDNVEHKMINVPKGTHHETEYVKTVKYFKGTFDGDNKTIKNLTVNHKYPGAGLFGNVQDAVIKNFSVTDATINGSSKWTAVVVGFSNGSLTMENVKVSNAEINMGSDTDGAVKLAGLVSYMNGTGKDIVLKGCSVTDFVINGAHYNAAGLAGYILGAKSFLIENCQTKNISIIRSVDAVNDGKPNYNSAFLGCFSNTTDKTATSAVFKNNTVSGTYTYNGTAVGLSSFSISDAGNAADSNYNGFVCAPWFGDCDGTATKITIDGGVYAYSNGKYTLSQQ